MPFKKTRLSSLIIVELNSVNSFNGDHFLVFRIFTKDYCIQLAKAESEQIGRKAPPPLPSHPSEENFDFGSIHFGQFPATLIFVAEEPPLPPPTQVRKVFDFGSIHFGDFQQLWFLWQKSPPPLPPKVREISLFQIYPFRAISSNFGFCCRKPRLSKRHSTQLTPFKTISPNFIIVYPIDSFQDHMIKLGQIILKGINWVHNYKIRSYGLERSQLGTQ